LLVLVISNCADALGVVVPIPTLCADNIEYCSKKTKQIVILLITEA